MASTRGRNRGKKSKNEKGFDGRTKLSGKDYERKLQAAVLRRARTLTRKARSSASPPLHAHESVMDGGRLIEPMVSVAVRRLAAGGPTMRIEGELVMSQRDLVTLRALWLDRSGRSSLGDRPEPGGEPH